MGIFKIIRNTNDGLKYMYNALKNANDNYDDEKQEKFDRYLMFDDEEKTVWVIWYEGVQ